MHLKDAFGQLTSQEKELLSLPGVCSRLSHDNAHSRLYFSVLVSRDEPLQVIVVHCGKAGLIFNKWYPHSSFRHFYTHLFIDPLPAKDQRDSKKAHGEIIFLDHKNDPHVTFAGGARSAFWELLSTASELEPGQPLHIQDLPGEHILPILYEAGLHRRLINDPRHELNDDFVSQIVDFDYKILEPVSFEKGGIPYKFELELKPSDDSAFLHQIYSAPGKKDYVDQIHDYQTRQQALTHVRFLGLAPESWKTFPDDNLKDPENPFIDSQFYKFRVLPLKNPLEF
jgi:hypothetical protein